MLSTVVCSTATLTEETLFLSWQVFPHLIHRLSDQLSLVVQSSSTRALAARTRLAFLAIALTFA